MARAIAKGSYRKRGVEGERVGVAHTSNGFAY